MTYRKIKYVFLLGLIFLNLHLLIPFGDYCSGFAEVLLYILFGGLFFLTFLMFSTIDLVRKIKKKVKFDFIPVFLLIFFLTANWIVLTRENRKFWKKAELEGVFEINDEQVAKLILYNNGTFDVVVSYIESNCVYSGRYLIQNQNLTLKRSDLEEQTNMTFTTKYRIDLQGSLLLPFDSTFERIKIEKLGATKAIHHAEY